jgi:hypothetical protein
MAKKTIDVLMILAIIFSTISVIGECLKQECTESISANWNIAHEKNILSLRAYIDRNIDLSNRLDSDWDEMIKTIKELDKDKQWYAKIALFSHAFSLTFSILAFILILRT